MIKRFLSCVLTALLLACGASGQEVFYSERHEFEFSEDRDRLTQTASVSVRYMTERATDWDEFGIYEQYFSPVESVRAEVNGQRLGRDAIRQVMPESRDVFLSDGVLHLIDLPTSPNAGDVVSYTYQKNYVSAAYAPLLVVPSRGFVSEYSVHVDHPDDVDVSFRVYSPRGETVHSVTTTGRGSLVTFKDLAPLEDLPLFPYNGVHAFVMLDIRDDQRAFTPTTAGEFGQWYQTLVGDRDALPVIQPLAESLGGETDSMSVAAFHDYVRETIRYIADERGEGAFVPRAPDIVVDRAYGDCKDRAYLVRALAQTLGVRVDPVLISTRVEPEFDDVHLSLFNHVICSYDDPNGDRTYFDPTNPYLAFGDLPESDIDGQALRIGPDGAERVVVPSQSDDPALDVRIDVDLDAPEASEAEIVVRGTMLELVRAVEARRTEMDARNALSGVAGDLLYKIRIGDLEPLAESPRQRTYRARADLSSFVIASPTKRYIPLTPFRTIDPRAGEREADAFMIRTEDRPNVRLRLDVADGWVPDSTDHALGEPSAAIWFHASASPEASGDGSVVDYAFGQRTKRFVGDDRAHFLSLADAYLGSRREVITFRQPAE